MTNQNKKPFNIFLLGRISKNKTKNKLCYFIDIFDYFKPYRILIFDQDEVAPLYRENRNF